MIKALPFAYIKRRRIALVGDALISLTYTRRNSHPLKRNLLARSHATKNSQTTLLAYRVKTEDSQIQGREEGHFKLVKNQMFYPTIEFCGTPLASLDDKYSF